MKRNDPISKIMSTEIVSVHVKQKLSEVRHVLGENNIHHVPVLSGEKLVGMVSTTDMVKLTFEPYDADERSVDAILDYQFKLEDVMQKELTTIKTSQTVRDAAELLGEGKFHSIPVVDDDDNLKGIVTSTDLIRYLLKQY